MKIRVGINGFGRIGRLAMRAAFGNDRMEVVAINDITTVPMLAHLLKYDSVHGRFCGDVVVEGNNIMVDGKPIRVLAEPDPEKLPWKDLGVDVVIESSGKFTKRQDTEKHIRAGAKKVIISAPATDPDWTVVLGVNHTDYDPDRHNIISNASCTTNCLAPIAKVVLDNFGIERGIMTTVHAYTNDQKILDLPHKDPRRARAAALSMIPTTTGAAKAVALVLPQLKGKLSGLAVRVPTPNVSLVDLVVITEQDAPVEAVNQALKKACENELKGILAYCEEKLVSMDFNHDFHSGTVDSKCTMSDGRMVKIFAWYDNEWGYSCRIIDLIGYLFK